MSLGVNSSVAVFTCAAAAIPYPTLPGAEFISLAATEVKNYSLPSANLTGLNFCNISVSYTHPGQNDTINVQVWLPSETWTGRFMGTGGGGYATGQFDLALAPAVALGYSAVSTDGGHALDSRSAQSWAQISPGNVNLYLLQDFASVSLNDMTVIGKEITRSYYAVEPKYSYWNGCSTGGRQGLMMAQRYPEGYNGILAGAPAINWPSFIVAEYWPQFVMNQLGSYPSSCELDTLTAAAIEACDGDDGLVDGIISAPGLCHFDPHTAVGRSISCESGEIVISQAAATVAQAAWTGPQSADGRRLWYGLSHDASLLGLANTTCSSNDSCVGAPFPIATDWIKLFIEKNESFSLETISHKDYETIFHASRQQFTSMIGTDDPDLSGFGAAGGKMISWHGLADQLIFPNGTANYYDRVAQSDPGVSQYFRYFEAPGVGHCGGGIGPAPTTALDSLVDWVEKGQAPVTLDAASFPINGISRKQRLCPYPLVSAYVSGDPLNADSYHCATSFGKKDSCL
ncbi:Tannase/feruloyl esterase [Cadophora sp. MPI-SDFR-AT-0126]|nr:Tannase/feruloyl esterase [Leotiomycetes sp. MPI-SDFR-AT-0126]